MDRKPSISQSTQPSGSSPGFSLELFHGLWRAMVAKTLVKLEIPARLLDGQKTVAELANATGTLPDALYRFLRAAAACQFIDEIPTSEELSQRIFAASTDSQAMCPGQPLYDSSRGEVDRGWQDSRRTSRVDNSTRSISARGLAIYLKSRLTALRPISSSGWRTVERGGCI